MKMLLIRHHENNVDAFAPRWAGSLAYAKGAIRDHVPKTMRDVVVVEEFNVQTDKAGVLGMLSGAPVYDPKPLRTWGVTPRGGLKEE